MGRIISNGIDFSGTNLITPECYSTEERVVGCWTDGKPLYQKTISFGALPNSSTKTVSCNLTNLDNVVGIEGIAYNQNGTRNLPFIDDASKNYDVLLDYIKSNDVVRIICHSDLSSLTGFVTIKYTKSTDTAGSGVWTPSDLPSVHYSTEEHVIGTWVDGSTLYEKTIDLGSDLIISYNSWTSLGITLNADKIIGTEVTASVGSFQGNILMYNDNGTWKGQSPRNSEGSYVRYLTVKYTKSTS